MAETPATALHSKVELQAEIAIPLGQESEVSTASVTAEGITSDTDAPNAVALEVDTPEESEQERATVVQPHVHYEDIFCRNNNGTNFYILLTVAVVAGALVTGAIIEDVLRHPTTANKNKNATTTNNNTTRDEIRESIIEMQGPHRISKRFLQRDEAP